MEILLINTTSILLCDKNILLRIWFIYQWDKTNRCIFCQKHVNLVIYQSTNYINAGQTVDNIWLEFVYGILHGRFPLINHFTPVLIKGELG